MRHAGLDEAQAGIKIGGRNINNLRHADDTTLKVESIEEQKNLLMNVKEKSEKTGSKQRSWHPIPSWQSWQIEGENVKSVADFIFLGSKLTADGDYRHEIKRCLLLGRKAMTNVAC